MKFKVIGSVFLLFSVHLVFAQKGDIWGSFYEKYKNERVVFVERSETLNISVVGDSLQVFSENVEDILHLKDQSDFYASKRIYGSHFNEVQNIKAKTLVWDKKKYREIAVADFKKNSDRSQGVFFDDSYYYTFNFPSVASRNRTHLEYREVIKDPKFVTGFLFSSYMPQEKSTYTIKASKDIELSYWVENDPDKKINFKKTESGKEIIYEWSGKDIPAYANEEKSPSIRYFEPHVICYVKSYTANNKKINVLSNLDDLYNWYYTFIKDLNGSSSPELLKIVQEIKDNSKNELEVVKKIFYWVQDNIQYIAFEEGMRGLIPHHGSYVCEKRYGDCKDMANLIVNMLDLAGVKAYHTWIGTRDIPYPYSKLPTPLVDNHMIATYISQDGKYYFLDGTSNYTPFGMPSSMIQGKEALIGFGKEKYEVKKVPVMEKERNVMTDFISLRLEGNELIGKGISTLDGYPKVFGAYNMDRAEHEDVKKYVTKLLGKGSNKFFLDKFDIKDLKNQDKATTINYSFRIGDYFQNIGNEIYLNLNLNKDYYNDYINLDNRKTPMEMDYQYIHHDEFEFEIPANYEIEYLPPAFSQDGKLMGFEITYVHTGNKIKYSRKFFMKHLLMEPDDFKKWNESVKAMSEAYKETVILKKK